MNRYPLRRPCHERLASSRSAPCEAADHAPRYAREGGTHVASFPGGTAWRSPRGTSYIKEKVEEGEELVA